MPDPISLLGAAAAIVQCGDVAGRALLNTVKLLKNLQETPRRMLQQLQDVTKSIERIVYICNTILAPGSPVLLHLTSKQLRRIEDILLDVKLAMQALQQSLQKLSLKENSATENYAKIIWRAVVSVANEKIIEENVKRVIRLQLEVMQALQIIELEMHSTTW